VLDEAHKLIEITKFPAFTTAMGKGALDETMPEFAGVHLGAGSLPGVTKALESADVVIWIGNVPSDLNTGEFTTVVSNSATIIDLQRFLVWIGKTRYQVGMKHVSSCRG
jgi:pyruvate decarboxylase